MNKFIKLSDGTVLNTAFISHINPVLGRSVSANDLWGLAQAGAVKTPILKWVRCKNFTETKQRVAEDPSHRGYANDATNPGFYEATDELGYTDKILDGKGSYVKRSSLLTQEQLDSVAYYVVHLVTPSGGMNYSHVILDVTKDDYKKIEDAVEL